MVVVFGVLFVVLGVISVCFVFINEVKQYLLPNVGGFFYGHRI